MELHFSKLHIIADMSAETCKHLQPCCTHQDTEVTPHLLSHFVPFMINYTASTLLEEDWSLCCGCNRLSSTCFLGHLWCCCFQADTIIMISPSDSMPCPFDASQHNDKSELPTSMTRLSILILPCMKHIPHNGKDILLDTCLHFSSLFIQYWVHWSFYWSLVIHIKIEWRILRNHYIDEIIAWQSNLHYGLFTKVLLYPGIFNAWHEYTACCNSGFSVPLSQGN